MIRYELAKWAELLGGQVNASPQALPHSLKMNTQSVVKGDLFVALSGGARDGHEFIAHAREKGAWVLGQTSECDWQVEDSIQTLQAIGELHREVLIGHRVAITGSMGKTTTRRMAQAAFQACLGRTVLATQGNYNNHLGVPLTLSRVEAETDAVLELGANHQGEINVLAGWVQPTIATITMAGPAHLEGFGGIEGVIKGKGEILDHITPGGVAVLNRDDIAFAQWSLRAAKHSQLTFGRQANADVRLLPNGDLYVDGQAFPMNLALSGAHQQMNAACATALCVAAGLDVATAIAAIEQVQPEPGRGAKVALMTGATVIDDTYNANPEAMRAAIQATLAQRADALVILGPMRELGEHSAALHAQLGEFCRRIGVQRLWTTDVDIAGGFGEEARWFESVAEVAQQLASVSTSQDLILVKGSRGAAMEGCFSRLIKGEA